MNCRVLLEQQLDLLQSISSSKEVIGLQQTINIIRSKRVEVMAIHYHDIFVDPRYELAARFLLYDLYASEDLIDRMLELQRAKSAMSKILPEVMMMTIVRALEFSNLALQIDIAIAKQIDGLVSQDLLLSNDLYAEAIVNAVQRHQMQQQLELVLAVGVEIESVVHKPFVATALRMFRRPAKLMELSELQDFLERGFSAFKSMRGSNEFFRVFNERENSYLNELYRN